MNKYIFLCQLALEEWHRHLSGSEDENCVLTRVQIVYFGEIMGN